jgi:hypothetical protein
MPKPTTTTTSQGPSAHNQSSDDHSLDSNQAARQPTTRQVLKAAGLDIQSEVDRTDLSSANID